MDATNTQDQDTQGQVQDNGTGEDTAPAKLYATRSEAEANKPADAPKGLRPFEGMHNGTSKGWILARGYDNALATLARIDGYTVSTGKATAPVTKEAVAAKLATFSDDELAALGLTRKKAKK